MITLYHLNHGCNDCEPGHVFNLLLIDFAEDSEHAEAYEEWKVAFPDGLSVFGYRHMTLGHNYGEVPQSKLKLEYDCELVRRRYFDHIPSRYQAFFAVASIEEAIAFRDLTQSETGITGSIWEIAAERIVHRGDMRRLTPEQCSEENLRAYWQGLPLDYRTPIWECMVIPPVTMVCCVMP